MVNIMSMLTTKRAREVRPEVVTVVLPLVFVVIIPLGVLVTLILVVEGSGYYGSGCWGLFPPGPGLLLFCFFPFFLALFD
jgi:hypothetical protein